MRAGHTRNDDDSILAALAMWSAGNSLAEIGEALGMPRSNVGLFTSAVRDADLLESAEPAVVVRCAYQWKVQSGGRR